MLFANTGAGARTGLDAAPDALWLDLVNPTEAERAHASTVAGFEVQTHDEIGEIESSSRVSTEDGVLYLNAAIAYRDAEGRSATAPLGFALSQHRLVTLRYVDMPVIDGYAERFAHAKHACSSEAFVGIVEAIVDRVADVMEHVGAELDRLSKQTFRGEDGRHRRSPRRADSELRATLTSVGRCGDTISNLRDTLLGLTRIVGYTQKTAAAWIPNEIKERLATAHQDIASLNDYDQQLTAKTSFLLDAVLGFISIEQNNSVKLLTVVSVIGIPPTFVVGLYGMNFKNMPEYDWAWGYQFGWLLIIISVVAPFVFFRFKGWV